MTDAQRMVTEFHRTFDLAIAPAPTIPDEATCALRIRLIAEEFAELQEALARQDLVNVAKELADLLYVIYGTAVSCGIDLEPVVREVHRWNLSRAGRPKPTDGQWIKPLPCAPAALGPLLAAQRRANGSPDR